MKNIVSSIKQYRSFDQLLIEAGSEHKIIDFQLQMLNSGSLPDLVPLAIIKNDDGLIITADLGKNNTYDLVDASARGDVKTGLVRLVQLSDLICLAEEHLFSPQQAITDVQTIRFYTINNNSNLAEQSEYLDELTMSDMQPHIVMLPIDTVSNQKVSDDNDLITSFSQFYGFSDNLAENLRKCLSRGDWSNLGSIALAELEEDNQHMVNGSETENRRKKDNKSVSISSKLYPYSKQILLILWLVVATGYTLLTSYNITGNLLQAHPIANFALLISGIILILNVFYEKFSHVISGLLSGIKQPKGKKQTANCTELINRNADSFGMAILSEGLPGTPQENEGKRAFILLDEFIIGRDSSLADLLLESKTVGRKHARISRHEGSYFITDLGSKNGTRLDGRRLNKNEEYLLPDRCRLQFADCIFFFQNEEPL